VDQKQLEIPVFLDLQRFRTIEEATDFIQYLKKKVNGQQRQLEYHIDFATPQSYLENLETK
jgi:hypothetical protein